MVKLILISKRTYSKKLENTIFELELVEGIFLISGGVREPFFELTRWLHTNMLHLKIYFRVGACRGHFLFKLRVGKGVFFFKMRKYPQVFNYYLRNFLYCWFSVSRHSK